MNVGNVLLKFQLQGTQSNLNDLIKKLDNTIKVLLEAEKNPTKRKIVEEKNHSTIIPAALVAPVSKPSLSKLHPMPRAWPSKNVSVCFIRLIYLQFMNRIVFMISLFFIF